MITKIAITGAESSGKTTLANSLGIIYKCNVVKEFAREYLNELNREYNYEDLLKIAKGQFKEEKRLENLEKKILICDTAIHTIKIWSIEKFHKCHSWTAKKKEDYTHYLLCSPDIPWEDDPLRENPKDRKRIFKLYLKELKNKPLTVISGTPLERIKQAQKVINRYIN
tara:strand:- start:780 stop:1283 length:504 start_codon:yes stop_codon:yes gene_type:complete